MFGGFWIAAQLAASQEGLSSLQLVIATVSWQCAETKHARRCANVSPYVVPLFLIKLWVNFTLLQSLFKFIGMLRNLEERWLNRPWPYSPFIQGVSKRDLQCYSKCYSVASVTKTFTLKGVQTIHRSRCTQVLEYQCKALFETPCITNGSYIEP
jgi:hypothetical protein